MHDEYFKNIFDYSHKPQNYKQKVVYLVNAAFLGPVMIPGTFDLTFDLEGIHICHTS